MQKNSATAPIFIINEHWHSTLNPIERQCGRRCSKGIKFNEANYGSSKRHVVKKNALNMLFLPYVSIAVRGKVLLAKCDTDSVFVTVFISILMASNKVHRAVTVWLVQCKEWNRWFWLVQFSISICAGDGDLWFYMRFSNFIVRETITGNFETSPIFHFSRYADADAMRPAWGMSVATNTGKRTSAWYVSITRHWKLAE